MAARTRKPRLTAEQVARQARIAEMVARVHEAIQDGRCFLDTFLGRYKVASYNHETGYAVSHPADKTPNMYNQHSFMVCVDRFIIV
jgi:hypothetical protein